jgi:hypothetical protein
MMTLSKVENPVLRLSNTLSQVGAHTKPKDTRTTEELLSNIDYFAKNIKDVAEFKNELKSISPKHLGLVSDICELSSSQNGKTLKQPTITGKSILSRILEILPIASKKNPNSLDFAQEVINQTDSKTSIYFLTSHLRMFILPEASERFALTKPFVKDIAEATLSGGLHKGFTSEQKFANVVDQFVSPSVKIKNLKMLSKISKASEKAPLKTCYINPSQILHTDVPIKTMEENLKTFNKIAPELAKTTDEINLTEFVTKNTNLY